MKKTIVKYKHAIIALIMIVLNSVGASASAPWTVNPSSYRYDMSLYLDVTFAASGMDYSLYDVGVFCGDECRGVAEVLSLSNGKSCLYVRARSNQESGETMTFKYYDKETEKISDIDGVSFSFESDGRLGYPSDPYVVKIIRHFDVVLSAGVGGTINHAGGRIAEGTEISLTATPDEGYHFEKWSDESTENPRTIVVNDDITLSAEFVVNTYKLTYTVDGVEYKSLDVDYGTALTAEAIPEKEGHTFSGWEGLPETMPAHDVTVSGTFSINSYNVVFKIGEDVIETKSVVFGQPVVAPEAPAKEGHTFAGWQNVPETMPANDVEILGTYTVNQYKLTYTVDGATYKEYTVDYGTAITPETEPTKTGYTFSGWDNVPGTMPANDVTVSGSFTINRYLLTFQTPDGVVSSEEVDYNSAITAPEAPEKEGHSFAGWEEFPETMPANDLTVNGSYSVNNYDIVYVVDGETYKTVPTPFGSTVTPEADPVKEGYTFSGWSGLPETMPAQTVTATGSFSINSYTLTFKIGEEVISSETVEYASAITAPDAPEKEGHTFAGWEEFPETMPANDLTVNGSYSVNSYKLIYVVDGETYKEIDVDYGTAITPETAPVKEGYTFSGWSGLPETMPAQTVTVTGSFSINSYTLTFKIGEEVISSETVEYASAITAPEAPEKEGHSFAGWEEFPETMPANDLTVNGSYSVNNYDIVYVVDGETYKTVPTPFGSTVTPEADPVKEGYTFSGWSGLPETMPAETVTVTGSFSINTYKLTVYLDDEVYMEEELEFGSPVTIPDPELPDGYKFDGWQEEIPETMPAHDVEIHGTTTSPGAVISAICDVEGRVDIYTLSGYPLFRNADLEEVADKLTSGTVYIINGKKILIK